MTELVECPVSFPSADSAVTLAGTLTLSSPERKAPAAVLVSGTGPIDRDCTFVGHTLFRVLAHSLAAAGIATLRFDKRGVGESGGDFSAAGPEEFAADVFGALDYLIDCQGFSAERTGLIGHSEGGMVALTAASRRQRLPFCVLLASPLLSGKANLVRSFALLARGGLQRDGEYERHVKGLAKLLEIARSETAPSLIPDALEKADLLAPLIVNDQTSVILGTNRLSGNEFLGLLSSSCLTTALSWEPSRIVPLVSCPVLAIYGSKDVQAPAQENLKEAKALLESGNKVGWKLLEAAGMNHAFQRCRTGMPDEYPRLDHVMADEVVEEVARWIHSKVEFSTRRPESET